MKNTFLIILFLITSICSSQVAKDMKRVYHGSNRTMVNTNNITATPVNDNCVAAITIPAVDLNGTCLAGYTTINATADGTPPSCFDMNNNVWFKFVAQGPDIEIAVNQDNSRGTAIINPQVAIFSITGCPNVGYSEVTCSSYDCNTGWPTWCPLYSEVWVTNQGAGLCTPDPGATSVIATKNLVVGNTYYITVSTGKYGTPGDFLICTNNPTANQAGTDCSTATLLCSNSAVGGNASLWGSQDLTTSTIGGCLNGCGEVNSSWYVLSVATSGTLTFAISPTVGTDDYDFAVYKGATCTLDAPINCNYSATPGNTGLKLAGGGGASQGQAGTPWNNFMNVFAGDVYIVLVNGFTPSANSYTMSFGGTATLGCTMPPILPIELIYFNSSCDKSESNILTWASATETNNNYFTIERSTNGVGWDELGRINGVGNSTIERVYSFVDNAPRLAINYYRLSQTDFNGKTTVLGTIACDAKKKSGVNIYPNPTCDILNILVQGNAGETIVSIKNILGQEIHSFSVNNNELSTINISEYAKGVYFVEVDSKNVQIKLIKR